MFTVVRVARTWYPEKCPDVFGVLRVFTKHFASMSAVIKLFIVHPG